MVERFVPQLTNSPSKLAGNVLKTILKISKENKKKHKEV